MESHLCLSSGLDEALLEVLDLLGESLHLIPLVVHLAQFCIGIELSLLVGITAN